MKKIFFKKCIIYMVAPHILSLEIHVLIYKYIYIYIYNDFGIDNDAL